MDDDVTWLVFLFGDFQCNRGEVWVRRFATKLHRKVFVFLAINYGKPVHQEMVARAVWPDVDPESALVSLKRALSDIRSKLGNILNNDDSRLQIISSCVVVDLFVYSEKIKRAQALDTDISQRARLLLEAISLYGTGLVSEKDFDVGLINSERTKSAMAYVKALNDLATLYTKTGAFDQALKWAARCADSCRAELREILRLTPQNETYFMSVLNDVWFLQMYVHVRKDEATSARKIYDEHLKLVKERKADASPNMENLVKHLEQGDKYVLPSSLLDDRIDIVLDTEIPKPSEVLKAWATKNTTNVHVPRESVPLVVEKGIACAGILLEAESEGPKIEGAYPALMDATDALEGMAGSQPYKRSGKHWLIAVSIAILLIVICWAAIVTQRKVPALRTDNPKSSPILIEATDKTRIVQFFRRRERESRTVVREGGQSARSALAKEFTPSRRVRALSDLSISDPLDRQPEQVSGDEQWLPSKQTLPAYLTSSEDHKNKHFVKIKCVKLKQTIPETSGGKTFCFKVSCLAPEYIVATDFEPRDGIEEQQSNYDFEHMWTRQANRKGLKTDSRTSITVTVWIGVKQGNTFPDRSTIKGVSWFISPPKEN